VVRSAPLALVKTAISGTPEHVVARHTLQQQTLRQSLWVVSDLTEVLGIRLQAECLEVGLRRRLPLLQGLLRRSLPVPRLQSKRPRPSLNYSTSKTRKCKCQSRAQQTFLDNAASGLCQLARRKTRTLA
jgi:hypothetical protein